MKFIMAYSGGKDCTLALDRMIALGNDPVCLYTSVTKSLLNFNHGIRPEVFAQYEECFGIPVALSFVDRRCEDTDTSNALKKIIRDTGAEALCTGDINRADIYAWNRKMADLLGVELITPLFHEEPESLMEEFLSKGYKACVKVVETDQLPKELLGRTIDRNLIEFFKSRIDMCGEQGEYHSLTTDGPIFKKPLKIRFGNVISLDHIAMIDAVADQ